MNALLDEFGVGDAQERDESWRYSKAALRALSQQEFALALGDAALSSALIERFDWPETRGSRLVFINGRIAERYSDGAAVESALQIAHENERVALTIAATLDRPLHLVYVNVPGAQRSRWTASCDVDVHAGNATLIEQHISDPSADMLGSLTSNISVASGADLHIITQSDLADSASLYRRSIAHIDGVLRTTHALAGGRLQRFDLACRLNKPKSRYDGRGVFALRGRQHVDVHLDIRHSARNTSSDILWRGIADQRSRGILHGAITVAQGADGADAQLQTKNILLSANAEIDAQPVLEIYADEVKASHGATVGQLDERALFYLRSRGVPASDARTMLISGFANEALGFVDGPIRARLDAWLAQHLQLTVEPTS
jgi:Fe-S cluster assembly protein SufD